MKKGQLEKRKIANKGIAFSLLVIVCIFGGFTSQQVRVDYTVSKLNFSNTSSIEIGSKIYNHSRLTSNNRLQK